MHKNRCANTNTIKQNNSERPVDALAVKKRDPLTDNLKSRDASASKNLILPNYEFGKGQYAIHPMKLSRFAAKN